MKESSSKTERFLNQSPTVIMKYFLIFALGSIALFFLISLFLPHNEQVQITPVGTTKSLSSPSVAFELTNASYNPETGYAELIFLLEAPLSSVQQSYQATARYDSDPNQILKATVVRPDLETLVVKIPSLPKTWDYLTVTLGIASEQNNAAKVTFRVTKNEMFCSGNVAEKSEEEYEKIGIENELIALQNDNETEQKNVDERVQKIFVLQQEIEELQQESAYQIDSEKDETNAVISSKQNEISNAQTEIAKSEDRIHENNMKMEKLSQRKETLG